MKFTLSTKPFADALNLGVIPNNISRYYRLSCLAQLTATKNELRINLEANNVATELLLKGSGDEDGPITSFVDCLVLKQLISTLETSTTTIEYVSGGLIIHSGQSKFNLPFFADSEDGQLRRPQLAPADANPIPLNLADWKFVKDYQMYAIALSFVHPIYTNAWVGADGDVIIGDFDNSRFTFSKKSKLGRTCLLSDTIINLFTSLPEGAKITMMDKSYRIDVKTDGFEYATEFTPKYEQDEGVGSYAAEDILASVVKDTENTIKLPVAPIAKYLTQSDLLASQSEYKIELRVTKDSIAFHDDNADCKVKYEGTSYDYTVAIKSTNLKPILSHLDTETFTLCPVKIEDSVDGLIISTDNVTIMVGAVDGE